MFFFSKALFLLSAFATVFPLARWQSGYAPACKAEYAGSIPACASILFAPVPPHQ